MSAGCPWWPLGKIYNLMIIYITLNFTSHRVNPGDTKIPKNIIITKWVNIFPRMPHL